MAERSDGVERSGTCPAGVEGGGAELPGPCLNESPAQESAGVRG